jgi:hypothetical protein
MYKEPPVKVPAPVPIENWDIALEVEATPHLVAFAVAVIPPLINIVGPAAL